MPSDKAGNIEAGGAWLRKNIDRFHPYLDLKHIERLTAMQIVDSCHLDRSEELVRDDVIQGFYRAYGFTCLDYYRQCERNA